MRIFVDFEFIENGDKHPIIPISVGVVREDGSNYYAEFNDVDWSLANSWVIENVKPIIGTVSDEPPKNKVTIAHEIREFVGEKPEFWGYFADYDWVILCQLYGKMIDLPEGWPKYCLDLKQWMWHLGVDRSSMPPNNNEHNALSDAIWNSQVFQTLLEFQQWQSWQDVEPK